MHEVQRSGVQLDICPDCGGVWLDRGELEKIQAGVREARTGMEAEVQRFEQDVTEFRRDPAAFHRRQHDEDDKRYGKKKRPFDLFEIFG